ncbi:hypothetical protein E2562_034215 [Oryza meyeriana var. granulata]|uniref:Uncharacterized protein n=1 Tax=Oryza meyeriana var. granulata TaxID=110450 RepID=A0A6G1CBH0_9ORYZ|nr:hypothetical protein E2562_034215 [Oryza meyeriana var. granulata]
MALTLARKLLPGGVAAVARAVAVGGGAGNSFGLWELVKAKAAELVVFLAGLLSAAADEAETLLFPPAEKRWLHVAVMVVLPAVLGALALHCLACCRPPARRTHDDK